MIILSTTLHNHKYICITFQIYPVTLAVVLCVPSQILVFSSIACMSKIRTRPSRPRNLLQIFSRRVFQSSSSIAQLVVGNNFVDTSIRAQSGPHLHHSYGGPCLNRRRRYCDYSIIYCVCLSSRCPWCGHQSLHSKPCPLAPPPWSTYKPKNKSKKWWYIRWCMTHHPKTWSSKAWTVVV